MKTKQQRVTKQPDLVKPLILGIVLFEIVPFAGPLMGGFLFGYLSRRGAIFGLGLGELCGILGAGVGLLLTLIVPTTELGNGIRSLIGINLLLGLLFVSAVGGFFGGWLASRRSK